MAGKHADQQGKSANRENKTGTLNQAAGLITNILRRAQVFLLLSGQNNQVPARFPVCCKETPGSGEDWRVFRT